MAKPKKSGNKLHVAHSNVEKAIKEYTKEVAKLDDEERTIEHSRLITDIFLRVYGPEKNSRKMLQSVLPRLNALPALDVPNNDWDDFDTTFDFYQELQVALGELI